MQNLIVTTALGLMIAHTTPVFSGEREDYAGLPLDDYHVEPVTPDRVIHAQHQGYDGLPVTRRPDTRMHSTEVAHHEGYDGLPLVIPARNDVFAAQD